MSGGGIQPHEKGRQSRHMMGSLGAMQRGKSLHGANPSHDGGPPEQRAVKPDRLVARQARPGRPARPAR